MTIKSNQFQEKNTGDFIFEEKKESKVKESKFLTHFSQKNNDNKNKSKNKNKKKLTLSGGSETRCS